MFFLNAAGLIAIGSTLFTAVTAGPRVALKGLVIGAALWLLYASAVLVVFYRAVTSLFG